MTTRWTPPATKPDTEAAVEIEVDRFCQAVCDMTHAGHLESLPAMVKAFSDWLIADGLTMHWRTKGLQLSYLRFEVAKEECAVIDSGSGKAVSLMRTAKFFTRECKRLIFGTLDCWCVKCNGTGRVAWRGGEQADKLVAFAMGTEVEKPQDASTMIATKQGVTVACECGGSGFIRRRKA